MRKFCIISNPLAGRGLPNQKLPVLKTLLTQRSYRFDIFWNELPTFLHGYSDLIIIGGDGTLNYTLNHFKQVDIPILVIPAGTGNDWSWHLSGGAHAKFSLEDWLDAPVERVDAGRCNGKIFLNAMGVGFDGEVAKKLVKKKFKGHLSYLVQVLSSILTFNEPEMIVNVDGNIFKDHFLMVNAANGSRFGGGFAIAPLAEIKDGMLDVVMVRKVPVFKRFYFLPKIQKGAHLTLPFINYMKAKAISIQCSTTLFGQLDGEVLADRYFQIEILRDQYLFRILK